MRSSNVATKFDPTGPKKQRTKILKSLEILDKIDPEYTNIYAPNIIDRYENCPDNLYDLCLAHFAAMYIHEEANMNYEPDDKKYSRDSRGGRFENCNDNKVKKCFGKNEKKNLANCGKISHYQQNEESRRVLLKLRQ